MSTIETVWLLSFDIVMLTAFVLGAALILLRTDWRAHETLNDCIVTIRNCIALLLIGNISTLLVWGLAILTLHDFLTRLNLQYLLEPLGAAFALIAALICILLFHSSAFYWCKRPLSDFTVTLRYVQRPVGYLLLLVAASAPVLFYYDFRSMKLQRAIASNDLDIVRGLIDEERVNVNSKGLFNGVTPLHRAIQIGEIDIVELLIRLGADTHRTTRWGNFTPLHYAVLYNSPDMVELPVNHGVSVTATFGHLAGGAALTIAESQNIPYMIDLIEKELLKSRIASKRVQSAIHRVSPLNDVLTFKHEDGYIVVDLARTRPKQPRPDSMPITIKARMGGKRRITFARVRWESGGMHYEVENSSYGEPNSKDTYSFIESFGSPVYHTRNFVVDVPVGLYTVEGLAGAVALDIEGWSASINIGGPGFRTRYFKEHVELKFRILTDGYVAFYPTEGRELYQTSEGRYYLVQEGVSDGPYGVATSPFRWLSNKDSSTDIFFVRDDWRNEDEATDYIKSSGGFGNRSSIGARANYLGWALRNRQGWYIVTLDGLRGPYDSIGEPGVFVVSGGLCYSVKIDDEWFVIFNGNTYGPYEGLYKADDWSPFVLEIDGSSAQWSVIEGGKVLSVVIP